MSQKFKHITPQFGVQPTGLPSGKKLGSAQFSLFSFNYRSLAVSLVVLSLLVQSVGFNVAGISTVAIARSNNAVTLSDAALSQAGNSGPVLMQARSSANSATQPAVIHPHIAFAKTYYANQTGDTTTGTPTSCAANNNTDCSLRTALNTAATDGHANPDLIILTSGASYTFTSTLPTLGGGTNNVPNSVYLTSSAAYTNSGSFPFICPAQSSAATIGGGSSISGLVLGNNDYLINLVVSNFTGDGVTFNGTNNTITCSVISNNGNNGITVNAANNAVGGVFGAGNSNLVSSKAEVVISGNSGDGILITGTNATNNKIQDADVVTNTVSGIVITGTASSNLIGSNNSSFYNEISNNTQGGLVIAGSGTNFNTVQGNLVGTDPNGAVGIGNGTGNGISISSQAMSNTIGGPAGYVNVVSNNLNGIVIDNSNFNTVQGNVVGANAGGTAALANTNNGINLVNGASNNIIGSAGGLGNLISGNTNEGISVNGGSTNANIIQNNLIGTNSNSSASLPNNDGISLQNGATNTVIGGTGAGQFNIISGNTNAGIIASGGTTGTQIVRNEIGTNASGDYRGVNLSGPHLGNAYGVVLEGGATQTLISQNVVAFNTTEGIQVDGATVVPDIASSKANPKIAATDQNTITQNSIYGNGGNGITLTNGANNSTATPVIQSAVITPANSTYTVTGTAPASSTVEVFLGNNSGSTNSYQGVTYFGTATADGSGKFTLNGTLPSGFTVPPNPRLVATATSSNSTSQFSAPFAPFVISTITVNPSSLTFNYTQGSNNPVVQMATSQLTAVLSSSNVSTTVTYGAGTTGWLSVTPFSDNTNVQVGSPVTVTVTVNATGLTPGVHTATVTYTDNANSNNVASITVTFNIAAAPTATPTQVPPTATNTPVPPTATPTMTPPAATATGTPQTATATAVPPTATPPAATATATPIPTNSSYTYNLPFLANGLNGYTTYLAFQNIGTSPATISIQYFNTAGGSVATPSTTCATVVANGECIADNPFSATVSGAAILTSNQPLNVIVSEVTPLGGSAYTISAGSNSSLVAPFAINNNGSFNTQLSIFNAGSAVTTATVQFYNITGTIQTAATKVVNIGSHQNVTLDQTATTGSNPSNLAPGFYGWALITGANGSQLVAQVLEQNTATHFVAIANAQARPQTTLYAPAIFNNGYSVYKTGSNVINPNSSPVTTTITYYDLNGNPTTTTPFVIPAFAIQPIYQGSTTSGAGLPTNGLPNPYTGAASISSVGGGLVVAVNEAGGTTPGGGLQSGTYLAASQGSNKVFAPSVANGGFNGFVSGLTIFNSSNVSVTVTVQFYSYVNNTNNGTAVGTPKTVTIPAFASQGIYEADPSLGLPSNFYGTAVISASNGPVTSLLVTTNQQSSQFFYSYIEPTQ